MKAIIKSVTLLTKLLCRALGYRGKGPLPLRILNKSFYIHSFLMGKKLFLSYKYETQISLPLPPKGALIEPASLQKVVAGQSDPALIFNWFY